MEVRNLFRRSSILFEAANFGNIVFLTQEDKNFMRQLGVFAFENFDRKYFESLQELAEISPLYNMFKKESRAQLKENNKVFWEQETFDPKDPGHHLTVVSLSQNSFKESSNYILSKKITEKHVFLYLPIVEDWLHYYIPKSVNETFETREVLRCCSFPFKGQSKKRNAIIYNSVRDLVEVVREGNG